MLLFKKGMVMGGLLAASFAASQDPTWLQPLWTATPSPAATFERAEFDNGRALLFDTDNTDFIFAASTWVLVAANGTPIASGTVGAEGGNLFGDFDSTGGFYVAGRLNANTIRIQRHDANGALLNSANVVIPEVAAIVTDIEVVGSRVLVTVKGENNGHVIVRDLSLAPVSFFTRATAYDLSVINDAGVAYVVTREVRNATQAFLRKFDVTGALIGQLTTAATYDSLLYGRFESLATDARGHHFFQVNNQVYRLAPDLNLIGLANLATTTSTPNELIQQNPGVMMSQVPVASRHQWATGGSNGTQAQRFVATPTLQLTPTNFPVTGSADQFHYSPGLGLMYGIHNGGDLFGAYHVDSNQSFGPVGEMRDLIGVDDQDFLWAAVYTPTQFSQVRKYRVRPVAFSDTYLVGRNVPLTFTDVNRGVKFNDVKPTNVALVSGPTNGTLTLRPDGTFDYTPNAGFVGIDRFTYNYAEATEPAATVSLDVRDETGPAFVSPRSRDIQGQTVLLTDITLNRNAPAGGFQVRLIASPGVTLSPATPIVTVPAGARGVRASITVNPGPHVVAFSLAASNPGGTITAPSAAIQAVPAYPIGLSGSTTIARNSSVPYVITLSGNAGPSGQVVRITSAGGLTHPATVTVPAGTRSASFQVTAGNAASNTRIRAVCNGYSSIRGITVP